MFWIPKATGIAQEHQQIPLCLRRFEWMHDEMNLVDEEYVHAARWNWRGSAHYVSYTSMSPLHEELRTVLRLEPASLKLVKYGGVQWNHTFQRDQMHHSNLVMGNLSLSVETMTQALQMDVQPHGGHVSVKYEMVLAGHVQQVLLDIQFGSQLLGHTDVQLNR